MCVHVSTVPVDAQRTSVFLMGNRTKKNMLHRKVSKTLISVCIPGNKWSHNKFVSYKEMLNKIKAKWPNFSRLADEPNHTSKVSNV